MSAAPGSSKEIGGGRPVRRPPASLVLSLLLAAALGTVLVAVGIGSVSIPPLVTAKIVWNHLGLGTFPVTWSSQEETILWTLRLPRALGSALVGAALATAGALFQGLLRNPLADPYVVGTSGGAALGAVLGLVLGESLAFGFGVVPVLAFFGALGAMALVYQLARVGGRVPVVTVLLAGFAVSTLLGYTVSLLLFVSDRLQLQLPRIYAWLLGGVSVTGWSQLSVVAPLVLAALLAACFLSRSLNALALGEEGAARLGVPVERDKRLVLAVGSLLTGAAVSVSGLVGFVGLVVPHLVRVLCGPDHRLLLPASALAGAGFLTVADMLARTLVSPAELPVGIVTAFLGGPFFLWLLRRSRKEYQW